MDTTKNMKRLQGDKPPHRDYTVQVYLVGADYPVTHPCSGVDLDNERGTLALYNVPMFSPLHGWTSGRVVFMLRQVAYYTNRDNPQD